MGPAEDAARVGNSGGGDGSVHHHTDPAPAEPTLPFPAYAEVFVREAEETIAELFEADDDAEYLKDILVFDHKMLVGVNYVGGASLNALAKMSMLDCPECRHMLVSKTKRLFCEFLVFFLFFFFFFF